MKKLLLMSVAVGMAVSTMAQFQRDLTIRNADPVQVPKMDYKSTNEKAPYSSWYNFADEVSTVSTSGTYYFTVLFPDTSVKMIYSTGPGPVNFHSMGQVFDPKGSLWFSQTQKLDSSEAYSVDSLAFFYRYYRFQTQNPDTLIIQIYKHDKTLQASLTSNGTMFKTVRYSPVTYRGANADQTIVEILNESDTAKNGKLKEYALNNINVDPGEVMAATLTYFPGNPYNEGDTIFASTPIGNQINRFDQFYFSDPSFLYAAGYFNGGIYAPSIVRYNTGTSWDSIYVSGYAYQTAALHSDMYFKLTTDIDTITPPPPGGINDVDGRNFTLGDAYPNPANDVTYIEYSVTSPAIVNVDVLDITGKSVMSLNEGRKEVGDYRLELNVAELKEGMYFYTFKTEAGMLTKKLLIRK